MISYEKCLLFLKKIIAGKQLNKRIHASINLRLISLCRLSKLALIYLHTGS